MKIYKIYCDVYHLTIDLWVGGTEKDLVAEAKKIGQEMMEDGTLGTYFDIKKKDSQEITKRILWVGKKPKTIVDRAIFVHEIFHMVCAILSYKKILLEFYKDEKYIQSIEEAYAYLMEFYYRKIMEVLR